ncbi:MAG: hypothetical protein CME24_09535 [Gemmatimonadetes bacterium]|nr:hypothetical protein [Gemmatimonadota bacterium]
MQRALHEIAGRFRVTGLSYMNLCGHCNDTYEALLPAILPGDRLECEWMLVHRRDATLKSNPDVEIEVVEPNSAREDELRAACSKLARHEYYRTCDAHLEGPLVYAHLDGEVVGTAGWFIAGGLARFRSIRTVEHLRRRGVATSMIRFIQQQPQVREQDGLVIFCDTEDTIHLYERLGFVRHGYLWALFRPL